MHPSSSITLGLPPTKILLFSAKYVLCNVRTTAHMRNDERQRMSGAGPHLTVSEQDQLLVVLIHLRISASECDLSFRFDVSESTVLQIFQNWINYLYLHLGSLPIWPSWECGETNMLNCFSESYSTTFAIIDAMKSYCEVPASPSMQSQCYSSYVTYSTLYNKVNILRLYHVRASIGTRWLLPCFAFICIRIFVASPAVPVHVVRSSRTHSTSVPVW